MSNKVATITKNEGRCSFSRKALSAFMAVLLAFFMMPMVPAESAHAADPGAEFAGSHYGMTVPEGANGYELTYTGDAVAFGFEHITAQGTTQAYEEGDYLVRYFHDTNNDGVLSVGDERATGAYGIDAPTAVGTYFAVAIYNSAENLKHFPSGAIADGFEGGYFIAVKFDVVPRSIDEAFVYEVNPKNAQDFSDTEFTYNGKPIELGVAIGTDKLDSGKDADYTVSVNGKAVQPTAEGNFKLTADATDAGSYTVVITGKSGYFGKDQQVTRTVTVNKLDLSAAEFFTPNQQAGHAWIDGTTCWDITTADGVSLQDLADGQNLVINQFNYVDPVENADHGVGDGVYQKFDGNPTQAPAAGSYEFRVYATGGNQNVTGERVYSVDVVNEVVNKAFYGGKDLLDELDGEVFFGDEWAYNAGAVTMQRKGAPFNGFTATLTNAAGEVVAAPTAAGKYVLTLQVSVPDNYSVGGTVRAEFLYYAGEIDGSTLEVLSTIHGVNVPMGTTFPVQYTGDAVVPAITVKAGDTTLVPGADYTVEYTNEEGAIVDSMVDAGLYTVTVKLSDQYVFSNEGAANYAFKVQIDPRGLEALTVVVPEGAEGLLYTGEAITPQISGMYTTADGIIKTIILDPSWYELHGLSYKADGKEYFEPCDEINGVGEYMVNVVPTAECANYTWGQDVYTVHAFVVENANFLDVASDAWYAAEVAKAKALGYVDGMGNNLFFPDAKMTREQFAQVVYNMAGEPEVANGGVFGTYPTKFTDVSETSWSAKAISWASEAGIVAGTSETTFDPQGNVTREQIALMLYNYAANGADADLAALDTFADGDMVSAWAEKAVAWAVENGYMAGKDGNVLDPQGTATRAEIAALAVRVQPEAL